MRSFSFPPYRNLEVFILVYERTRSQVDDQKPLKDAIEAAEKEYISSCETKNFIYDSCIDLPIGLTKKAMISLYNNHLRDGIGQHIYDEIVEGDDGSTLCCYCGRIKADSADHYKEKAEFPLLAVYPGNLLPSCRICNTNLQGVENKFHGYFDKVEDLPWLKAEVLWDGSSENPPGISFTVNPSFSDDKQLVSRVSNTFLKAKLSGRWAAELAYGISQAHVRFLDMPSIEQRQAYISDWIKPDWEGMNGPRQAAVKAMKASKWIRRIGK